MQATTAECEINSKLQADMAKRKLVLQNGSQNGKAQAYMAKCELKWRNAS